MDADSCPALRQALKDLGIDDVYHYNAMLENPPDCDVWCKAFDLKFGKKRSSLNWTSEEWDVLLGDCMVSNTLRVDDLNTPRRLSTDIPLHFRL